METFVTLTQIDKTANLIKENISIIPKVGIILGSGLGEVADEVRAPVIIPYSDIPGWPLSSVVGHQGRLVIGKLGTQDVFVMQGRTHYYEGYPMDQITLPIRVMQRLGMSHLIVTNAAGAINPEFRPGDLMLITDHITFLAMAGQNPLRGPNLDQFGDRFPDMSQSYDKDFMNTARKIAKDAGIPLREGVYICLSGPSFETPADLRFLRTIGADAVGMSTVPEVIVARHGNMRVLGISGISNKANLDGSTVTTHEEVLLAGKILSPKMIRIIHGVVNMIEG
jgi:purine-nucleoside phosphorylase